MAASDLSNGTVTSLENYIIAAVQASVIALITAGIDAGIAKVIEKVSKPLLHFSATTVGGFISGTTVDALSQFMRNGEIDWGQAMLSGAYGAAFAATYWGVKHGINTKAGASNNDNKGKFNPEKTTLSNGEIAYKSNDGTLVRSPDYLDDMGNIKWPEHNGFVLDDMGNPIMNDANVKKGQILDRYGNSGGTFTSPVENGNPLAYDKRGVPYPESAMDYHQYEVVKDINIENVKQGFDNLNDLDRTMLETLMEQYDFTLSDIAEPKSGIISEVFGSGGGTQIKLGTSVSWYEKLGILKEIK